MPASRELPQQIPPPGNSLDAKVPGWGKFLVQIYGCAWEGGGGGVVLDEIDTCIIKM